MRRTISILFALALVLSFSLVATAPVAAATTYYVATGGDNGDNGLTPDTAWKTIQYAVDNVPAGATIIVAAGMYNEALLIGKPLTIQGAGVGESIVDGTGVGGSYVLRIQNVSSGSVAFDGFTVQNAPGTPSGFPVVITGCHAPAAVAVTNNAVVASKLYDWGVYAASSTASIVINHNVFDDYWMNAVLIERATGPVEVGHNVFKMADDGGAAIFSMSYESGTDPCDVDGLHWYHHNKISAKSDGEAIYGGITLASAYGTYYGERSHGAYANVIIEGNVISDLQSWSRGVQLEIDGPHGGFVNPQVIDNTITGSEKTATNMGIRLLGDVSAPIITGNTVGNLGYGVHLRGTFGESLYPTGVRISCNSIVGNIIGVANEGTEVADATLNWWGSDSGPTHATNPGGTGDAVSDNVDFTPWIKKTVITTATGTGPVLFSPSAGNIVGLTPVAAPGLPSVTFPHGMFSFQICCLTPGQTVDLTVTLPSNVPVGTVWWKYDNGRWHSLPNLNDNGNNVMVIQLTDGGTGDMDGKADGVITDPGGPGNPMTVGWDGSPVSKAGVMVPWIALLAAIMAAASLLVWRRRRAEG